MLLECNRNHSSRLSMESGAMEAGNEGEEDDEEVVDKHELE